MISKKEKIKLLLKTLLVLFIVFEFYSTVYRKEYIVLVINDVDRFSFNDTICDVWYYKDDLGSGIETRLKNYDTAFGFGGNDIKTSVMYFQYAKKGDVLIKEKNADTFYVKRKDTVAVFKLARSPY